ncbi:hypothetical protein CRG98_000661 [Punica granatum]|uniref:Uncharacterized protein n=1 Tax=Punica granatum TaxID=22663 RepID=A0A2I0LE65_PUNGR|nr:hypothetical protein CRG98_000661 [Punica granatum]
MGESSATLNHTVATPSHACPSGVPGKVDTPKLRCIGARMRTTTRLKFGCAQLGDSTGDILSGFSYRLGKGHLARPPARASTESATTRGPHRPATEREWRIFRDNMIASSTLGSITERGPIYPVHPPRTTGELRPPSRVDHLRSSPSLHGKASCGSRADPPPQAKRTPH